MCDALRELMKDDPAKAKLEGKLELLTKVAEAFSLDADEVMNTLHISAEEREFYRSKLS